METKEIKVVETKNSEISEVINYKEIAVHYLESMGLLKDFTPEQETQFVDLCEAFKLNPIKKEVYGVLYTDYKTGKKELNLIVGVDTYKKRAERTGLLDGYSVTFSGTLPHLVATITVYRKDWTHPFVHSVYQDEYDSGKSLWKSKPRTMLEKVAIAQGLRTCFPDELGGIPYTSEELPEEMSNTTPIDNDNSSKLSDAKIQNITPSEEKKNIIAPNVIAPNPTRPKNNGNYTPEQAQQLGEILNKKDPNGTPYFDPDSKAFFRNLLMSGKFDEAIKQATDELDALTTYYEGETK